MMYVIEFRSGSYWHYTTERLHRGVSREKAVRFVSRDAAEEVAGQWRLAGAMVIPYVEETAREELTRRAVTEPAAAELLEVMDADYGPGRVERIKSLVEEVW